MEQSGVVGFNAEGNAQRVTDFRDSPFCSQLVFAEMIGLEEISQDVVRGWVESNAIPTVKIGRRRVINLHRIRRDIDRGKTIFCAGTTQMTSAASHENAQRLSASAARRGLWLLCLLVKGRDGERRFLPIHTMRSLPPRISSADTPLKDGPGSWRLEGLTVGVGSNAGL